MNTTIDRNPLAAAFNRVMGLNDNLVNFDDAELGRLIMELNPTETVSAGYPPIKPAKAPKLFIDDIAGVNYQGDTELGRLVMHLDFLRRDIQNHPAIKPEQLTEFVKSEYGQLHQKLTRYLRSNPNGEIHWFIASKLDRNGYLVGYVKATGKLYVQVGNSAIIV